MSIKLEKIKKLFILLMVITVAILVIYALYSNKSRFYDSETIRYSSVTIDEKTDIDDIISEYSGETNKDKFISAIKKVNNITDIENETIYGRTIYIPLIEN